MGDHASISTEKETRNMVLSMLSREDIVARRASTSEGRLTFVVGLVPGLSRSYAGRGRTACAPTFAAERISK